MHSVRRVGTGFGRRGIPSEVHSSSQFFILGGFATVLWPVGVICVSCSIPDRIQYEHTICLLLLLYVGLKGVEACLQPFGALIYLEKTSTPAQPIEIEPVHDVKLNAILHEMNDGLLLDVGVVWPGECSEHYQPCVV